MTAPRRVLPVTPAGAEPFVPPFPWLTPLRNDDLSTKRGFVFQYPPFPALEHVDAQVVDRPKVGGIYVHVPFCPYRCSYCYYAVEVNQHDDSVDRYLDALEGEMALVAQRPVTNQHAFTTAFIGGGTPTYLDETRLTRLVTAMRSRFDLGSLAEFTVEADPTTMSPSKAKTLVELGVNRISIGVQSFNDELNDLNERHHTARQATEAVDAVRAAGVENLNLDVICGLIGETDATWRATIGELLAIAPAHITIYLFSFRPQTLAHARVGRGTLPVPPDEDERIRLYLWARERLLDAGYGQTTPNCFVREPRWEQVHQRNAWSSFPLIGLGNSAYSYVDDCVTQNYRATSIYVRHVDEGTIPVEIGHRLTARDQMIRYCVLRLKQLRIHRADFVARFGFDVTEVFERELRELADLELLEVSADAVRLTTRGIVYVDDVCRTLYSSDTRSRLAQVEGVGMPKLVQSLV